MPFPILPRKSSSPNLTIGVYPVYYFMDDASVTKDRQPSRNRLRRSSARAFFAFVPASTRHLGPFRPRIRLVRQSGNLPPPRSTKVNKGYQRLTKVVFILLKTKVCTFCCPEGNRGNRQSLASFTYMSLTTCRLTIQQFNDSRFNDSTCPCILRFERF